jgi:polar amino acid transport system substrate-binding protein
MIAVATSRGTTAKYIAEKYNFYLCTDNADEIINNPNINTIFIFTRHNLHAEYVIKAIQQNKNVFVEKPLAMNIDELLAIKNAYETSNYTGRLMVGFNRRFAPQVQKLKTLFDKNQPKAINIRVNAGKVPKEHWVNDPKIGGGRIIGEGCHFIDLATFIADSKIKNIYANSIADADNLFDTVAINLYFENGSVANISYFSNGNKSLSKEYIEVFCDNRVIIIDDFINMKDYTNKINKTKLSSQDKGHANELVSFINSIKNNLPSPISFDELFNTTMATFAVLESCNTNRSVQI